MQKTVAKLLILTIAFTFALSVNYIFAAWSGPTQAPPGGNTPAPVHVGATNQVKDAGLSLNALAVFGRGYFEGNVGIGTISPSEALEVVGGVKVGNTTNANAGTIRWTGSDLEVYKGSAWVSLTSGGGGGETPGYTNCVNAGGDYISGQDVCYFPGINCPSEWSPKENYSSSDGNSCNGAASRCSADGTACSTGEHYRDNIATESCTYAVQRATCSGSSRTGSCSNWVCYPWSPWRVSTTCTASQTEIGCVKN